MPTRASSTPRLTASSNATPSRSRDWRSNERWPPTQQTVFGEDAYPPIPEKAAAYGFFIAENQPFIDGNKRTAAAAMATFLALNGFDLFERSETELAEVFERLGSRSIGQGEFFEWVANHVQPLDAGATDSEIDRRRFRGNAGGIVYGGGSVHAPILASQKLPFEDDASRTICARDISDAASRRECIA